MNDQAWIEWARAELAASAASAAEPFWHGMITPLVVAGTISALIMGLGMVLIVAVQSWPVHP